LAITNQASVVSNWTRSAEQRGLVDGRISIVEQDYTRLSDFALLYHAVTGQRPDMAWLESVANSGISTDQLAQIAYDFFQKQHGAQTQSLEVQVRALIEQVWGAATDQAVSTAVGYFNNGGTWAEAVKILALHEVARNKMLDSEGNLQLTTAVTLGEVGFTSFSGNDALYGGDGMDMLVGGGGNNILDGGAGIDLASFLGTINDYEVGMRLTSAGDTEMVVRDIHGWSENVIKEVELAKFGDAIYQFKANMPVLTVGVFVPAANLGDLLSASDLQAMGAPSAWLI
jgi:Ca2+-binding RTX toxin-like protein